MGEIKSTMDLVMERTRHLSLSAEERDKQKQAGFQKRLQGLLQQYADGALNDESLQERIGALQKELQLTDPRIVLQAVVKRFDPDQDNARWLELLGLMAAKMRPRLQEILIAHQEAHAALHQASRQRVLAQLDRSYAIGGSAVVPNPQQDPSYQKDLAALRRATQSKIDAVGSE